MSLFSSILVNQHHVLYQLQPPKKPSDYDMRQRSHHLTLPQLDDNLLRKNFLYRMMFRDTY